MLKYKTTYFHNIQGGIFMLKVLGDKLVIKVMEVEEEEKKSSLIVLPDSAKQKSQLAKVVEVGTGFLLNNGVTKPLDVKKDDVIVFEPFAGSPVQYDGVTYLVIRQSEIIAIVA